MTVQAPKLLIDWESPWRGFVTSIGPAWHRLPSHPRSDYIRSGISLRGPALCTFAEAALIASSLLILQNNLPKWEYQQELLVHNPRHFDAIVYVRPDLPSLSDSSGSGPARNELEGGSPARHAEQVIRVARGPRVTDSIAFGIPVPLRPPTVPVANLVALASPLPPPPMETLRAPIRPRSTSPEVVAPAVEIAEKTSHLQSQASIPTVVAPSVDITERRTQTVVGQQPIVVAPIAEDTAPARPKLVLPVAEIVGPPVDAAEIGRPTAMNSRVAGTLLLGGKVAGPSSGGRGGSGSSEFGTGENPGGSATAAGVVISGNPGDVVGRHGDGDGSLAMGPGGNGNGLGGSGKGTGPGHGTGTVGAHGNGDGSGFGTAPAGAPGFSPGSGPGGAGNGHTAGIGISIKGGNVYLPSFATGAGSTSPASLRPPTGRPPDLVVIASPRAGGALAAYRTFRGRVYTIYLTAESGGAVMQFSDAQPLPGRDDDITPPAPLRTEIPAELRRSRTVISALMDHRGYLQRVEIVEAAMPETAAKLVEALRNWQFRPAFRGSDVVDLDVLIGFSVGTK